ncbi:MAG: glycoside-pentoside-hexuronide (GPH):cation symporter [Spirochaetales bacterium]|jgi:sugar (glycoside-pentoside-hexuronide) transporter|nr:glycoside-pentoside-hexuronide (GPH):cation symporter [Spirochaetales bacterium]
MKNPVLVNVISKKERRAYALYFWGQNMIYVIVMNFIQNYWTDVVGLAAGTAAVIILIARFWDAVNDPMFGIIVDRSRLPGGRFKPWLRIAAFILPVLTILTFAVPVHLSLGIKTTLCAAAYILWGMAYTICDVPIFSLATAMTSSVQERTNLISLGRLFSFLGIGIVMFSIIPLTNAVGGAAGSLPLAWFLAACLFSLIGFFLMLPVSRAAQERTIDQTSPPITLKAMFEYLRSNTYLLVFYGAVIVSSLTNTTMVLPLYFTRVNLGSDALFMPVMLITLMGAPLVSAVLPLLNKKFDKFHILLAGNLLTIATSLIMYFAGYEAGRFGVFLTLSFIRGLGLACTTIMMFLFAADCVEYGTYKSGRRAEGTTFSIQTFATKMTSAVSGFVAMGLLGWFFHYQSSYYENGALIVPVQPQSAVQGIWFMYSIFPVIGVGISTLMLLFFYKLRDKAVQIMSNVNTGQISRDEGEALLREERWRVKGER